MFRFFLVCFLLAASLGRTAAPLVEKSAPLLLAEFFHSIKKAPAKAPQKKARICLNMIVKNESAVIRRCLDSVRPIIDYWVIVDTGSTDGTQEIIKAHMKDIPGELHERPWKNFAHNRTEALHFAKDKADYLLFMDADDWLEFTPDFKFPPLDQDLYYVWLHFGTHFDYIRAEMVRASLPWRWVGVVHEYLECDQPISRYTLENVKYMVGGDGARGHDPDKCLKQAKMLEEGLKEEPNNSRYVFYLAESYRDSGQTMKAIEWYSKRILLGGWPEEVFWSMYQMATLMQKIGSPLDTFLAAYGRAHRYRPHRPEPIYYQAKTYNQQGQHALAYECLKGWEHIPQPAQKDFLFNVEWIREYGLLFELSICSYYLGHYQESLDACDKLLTIANLPENWRKQVIANREFAVNALKK